MEGLDSILKTNICDKTGSTRSKDVACCMWGASFVESKIFLVQMENKRQAHCLEKKPHQALQSWVTSAFNLGNPLSLKNPVRRKKEQGPVAFSLNGLYRAKIAADLSGMLASGMDHHAKSSLSFIPFSRVHRDASKCPLFLNRCEHSSLSFEAFYGLQQCSLLRTRGKQ